MSGRLATYFDCLLNAGRRAIHRDLALQYLLFWMLTAVPEVERGYQTASARDSWRCACTGAHVYSASVQCDTTGKGACASSGLTGRRDGPKQQTICSTSHCDCRSRRHSRIRAARHTIATRCALATTQRRGGFYDATQWHTATRTPRGRQPLVADRAGQCRAGRWFGWEFSTVLA